MNTKINREIKSTTTLDINIRNNFLLDVKKYVKALVDGPKELFGNSLPLPAKNLNDILSEYIALGTEQLVKEGVHRARAKSIAKFTLNKILETEMNNISR